ncbi:unnamed protein product [Cylindrotheca closterium]|uniref:Uncharacterized protein n=1 Tax=Cylindrotheca closterium TaxID=2856 RepID=A0AAD2CFT3_9STRA|nr:unnamed protein product [Cylindrotheca closterium]
MLLGSTKVASMLSCVAMALGFTAASALEGSVLRGKDHSRRLTSEQVQFVNQCSEGLLSSDVLSDKIITQKEFTETFLSLCSQFGVEGCDQDASFETLDEDIQFAFASEMCHTRSSACLQSLITIGTVMHEVGYIVSSEGLMVDSLVNNICYELEYAVFGTPSDGVELIDIDNSYADTPAATGAKATGTNATNIIGAATAGSACLLLLFLVGGERRSLQQQMKSTKDVESNISYKTESSPESDTLADELVRALPTIMQDHDLAKNTSQFNLSMTSDVDAVFKAISRADWYEVYNMASQLSENEDLSTISSYGGQGNHRNYPALDQDRSHLSLEDQQRTRTLDRLAMNRDWTGVAVTAALYADESSSAKEMKGGYFLSQSAAAATQIADEKEFSCEVSGMVKERIDSAVDSGDWDKVLALSSQADVAKEGNNERDDNGLSTILYSQVLPDDTLSGSQKKLTENLFASNWALVGAYANRLRELEAQLTVDDKTLPLQSLLDINSTELSDSSDPEAVKKQTIAKLINEKKWKGISIMAGLYDMESKGCLSNDDGDQLP